MSDDGPRYAGLGDFRDHIDLDGALRAVRNGTRGEAPRIAVDLSAEPPFTKFMALIETTPRFKQSWERTRKDKDLQDKSPSGYDFSLASFAVEAGWSDDEIAALIVAARRKHMDGDGKALRADYIAKTIRNARDGKTQTDAINQLAQPTGEEVRNDRTAVLTLVSQALRLPVVGWIQHNRQEARYSLRLDGGREVLIGTIATVNSNDRFNDRVVEAVGVSIPVVKRERWRQIVAALSSIAEVIETADATRGNTLADWLRAYLKNARAVEAGPPAEVIDERDPFVRGDAVFIHARTFRTFVCGTLFERLEMADLTEMLREAGFRRKKENARRPAGHARGPMAGAHYWSAPRTVLDPEGAEISADPVAAEWAKTTPL